MLLIPPSVLSSALDFSPNMAEVTAAFQAAILGTESYLASRMSMGDFAYGSYTDYFYVERPGEVTGNLNKTELWLSRGLVTQVQSIAYAPDLASLSAGAGTALVAGTFIVDMEKGIIRDLTTDYDGDFVKVDYTSGFEPDDANPDLYKQSGVPDWMKSAAQLVAIANVANSPVLKDMKVKPDAKALMRQVEYVIGQHKRYAPLAVLPL